MHHIDRELLPWGPVYGGLLGGILKKLPKGGRRAQKKGSDIKEFLAKHRKQIEWYEALCKKLGENAYVDGKH